MGKQVRPSIIALLTSVLLVLFAAVGIVGGLPDGVTVPDEAMVSDEELADPEPDVGEFGNCASVIGCIIPKPPYLDAELEAGALEHQTLLASLSPALRAICLGGIRDRADALEKEWERKEAEREREEAEYAAFIEERFRRLNAGPSSKE